MANIRTVGLVAVGVDDTGVLRKLAGAALGATQFADWLSSQLAFGVNAVIEPLVDTDGKKVSARDVQDAVKRLIDRGDLDLLILYFAGHGIVKAGGDEQILLSDVGAYKDEAIAIAPTIANAWYSTVPNVVLISDACRNAVDPFGPLGTVSGKPALDRRAMLGARKSKVDVFYATEPSQTAKEFNGEGFFTTVLIDVLRRPPEGAYESRDDLGPSVAVIPAWNLETCLSIEVPLRAEQQTPPFSQTPDFLVTSRVPQFFGYASVPVARPRALRGTRTLTHRAAQRAVLTEAAQSRRTALNDIAVQVMTPFPQPGLEASARHAGLILHPDYAAGSGQGRLAFETSTGYSVIGGSLDQVLLSGGASGEVINGHDGRMSSDVRLYPSPLAAQPQRGSAALLFRGGTVCVVPVLPGYIGTLRLVDGRVASLTFEVSAQYATRFSTDADLPLLAERRALAAALAAAGKLQRLAAEEGEQLADFLRRSKRADPTLGIYSAYAYALLGKDVGVRSVYDWMSNHDSLDPDLGLAAAPVPFDVAMLARQITASTAERPPGFAPFCPMMTLGWSMIDAYLNKDCLHPAIVDAGRARLNAEWTTFRVQDVRSLLTALERGELQ
jgi:hypothetical protein